MLIHLQCGSLSATVDSDRGANCISLRHHERALTILRELHTPTPDNPFLYGIPILFPVNRISGGSFVFEGRRYSFPINEEKTQCHLHGTLHAIPFEVLSESQSSTHLIYRATKARPYLTFPHEFTVERIYSLDANSLTTQTAVTNLSDRNMPLMLGYHTTFSLPFREGGKIGDIRIKAENCESYERDDNYLPTGKPFPDATLLRELNEGIWKAAEKKISVHFHAGGTGEMAILDTASGIRIRYETDEKYPFRLIYGDGNAGFICLEPNSCLVDCAHAPAELQNDTGFTYLSPGEKRVYTCRISIETA